ncbi:MAG: hypothetical protein GXP31_14720 [Kiritimatiellaeota bacterium]|nr:hypothetical protein [Kiritimatiellota bacterium]
MKRHDLRLFVGLAALAPVLSSFGQIGIGLSADRRKYLRYEPIEVRVVLRNYTGNTLVFGLDPKDGFLKFRVTRTDRRAVRSTAPDANPAAGLILGTGETKTLTLAVNSLFDMQRVGSYEIRAVVGHPRLANDYISDPVSIDVRGGIVCWKRTLGVPASSPATRIQPREASLVLFHADKGDVYCLRVEDDSKVYGVVRLGPRIAGSKPECDVDAVSSIHVLLLIRPRFYAYRVYDYNVELLQERYYVMDRSVPHLVRDSEIGRIMVSGGRVAVEGVDYRINRPGAQRGSTGVPRPPAPEAAGGGSQPPEKKKETGFFRRLFRFGRKG